MKKLVLTSVMALASISLIIAPMLRAQDSTITIKDPAEFNTYNNACGHCADPTGQRDPNAKASAPALESFLQAYPQTFVKAAALDSLIDLYQATGDVDKTLSAATRLLQVDPNNMKAIYVSVLIKKSQCAKSVNQRTGLGDPQTCDDDAMLGRKGLLASKPAGMTDTDWKKLTAGTYPAYHSAIALDDAVSKKDYKGAVAEYTAELMLYTDDQTRSGPALQDTLFLAQAYCQPDAKDLVKAIWFYARVWNYVPAGYKPTIEKSLEYYYNKYHGDLKGLDEIKSQAALTTFPPGTLIIQAAPTPQELAHKAVMETPNLGAMNLGDAEYVLVNGLKEDVDKVWAALKDRATPVPGIVMEANASAMKVVVTQGVKQTDFIVNLTTPVACKNFPAAGVVLKDEEDYILSSGVKADTDKLSELFSEPKIPIKKIAIEPLVGVIKVAVSQDAKDARIPDFIVNLKSHVSCKEAPPVPFVYGQASKGDAELDGTYDNFSQVAATATSAQTAQIVLRDGVIIPKKVAPVRPKPSAGHPAAHPAR
jgi:tetratricopeptide (TPR) repeat protein